MPGLSKDFRISPAYLNAGVITALWLEYILAYHAYFAPVQCNEGIHVITTGSCASSQTIWAVFIPSAILFMLTMLVFLVRKPKSFALIASIFSLPITVFLPFGDWFSNLAYSWGWEITNYTLPEVLWLAPVGILPALALTIFKPSWVTGRWWALGACLLSLGYIAYVTIASSA